VLLALGGEGLEFKALLLKEPGNPDDGLVVVADWTVLVEGIIPKGFSLTWGC